MEQYALPIANLIEQLSKLPGIGKKTAQRLAFYILEMEGVEAEKLANSIMNAKEKIRLCSICCNLTDDDPCYICIDDRRDKSTICVVEGAKDIIAMERSRDYKGQYHILHGVISPMDNVGPNDIKVKELLMRLSDDVVKEIIIDKSNSRRRSDSFIFIKDYKTTRNKSNENSSWYSSWRRFRVL